MCSLISLAATTGEEKLDSTANKNSNAELLWWCLFYNIERNSIQWHYNNNKVWLFIFSVIPLTSKKCWKHQQLLYIIEWMWRGIHPFKRSHWILMKVILNCTDNVRWFTVSVWTKKKIFIHKWTLKWLRSFIIFFITFSFWIRIDDERLRVIKLDEMFYFVC